MLLHQLHQTYLLLDGPQPARARVLEARARRWAIMRRRLRDLLRAPAGRIPAGVHHG
ncbi:MAG TPA: hypothetical protein VFY32_01165 [Solirubrobacteraceae bacterium]|jgi:hypothetical protein|nr:hypothetical protein [Solirubrobacteraceae bacterium]